MISETADSVWRPKIFMLSLVVVMLKHFLGRGWINFNSNVFT